MEKQNNGVITDKNFKSNKIEPISNMAIDIMNTGLPLELAGAVAIDLYEKGYRKETQGEWVSVEDKLPQENEKVLAINSEGEIFIATYLVHKISPSARGYKTWASGLWNGTPTHWQPLPQPPKMKGVE